MARLLFLPKVLLLLLNLRQGLSEVGQALSSPPCPKGKCTLQERLQSLDDFFNSASPKVSDTTRPLGLKDFSHFLWKRIDALKDDVRSALGFSNPLGVSREGKQYYATGAEYATGYGVSYPGYGLYGTNTESSTTFNGLDAALSALAFLAFGVWLFNLVLPQIQVAGLGIPGIGRRIGHTEHTAGTVGRAIEESGNNVWEILSENQNSISDIFEKDIFSHSKTLLEKVVDGDFLRKAENAIILALEKRINDFIHKSGNAVLEVIQLFAKSRNSEGVKQEARIKKETQPTREFQSAVRKKFRKFSPTRKDQANPEAQLKKRRKREIEPLRGRGILEDLLGQVLKPFSFLADLISKHANTDYHFPNSRTEVVGDNLNGWGNSIPDISKNSLSDSWSGKRSDLDAKSTENSIEHKEQPFKYKELL